MTATEYLHKPADLTSGSLARRLDGSVLKKITISYTDLLAQDTTQQVVLATIPKNTKMLLAIIKHSQAFAAALLTACTVSLGTPSSWQAYTETHSLTAAPGDSVASDFSAMLPFLPSNHKLIAAFTATGCNFGSALGVPILTGGVVDIWVEYLTLP